MASLCISMSNFGMPSPLRGFAPSRKKAKLDLIHEIRLTNSTYGTPDRYF